MIQDQQMKDELRLKQCVHIMETLCITFGLPIVLDSLAIVCETPDGKAMLSAAAQIERAQKETGPTISPSPQQSLN